MKNIFICFTSIIIVILFCAYPWFLTMILKKTLLAWFIAIGGVFVTALLYIFSKQQQQQQQPIGLLPIFAPNAINEEFPRMRSHG